MGFYSNAGQNIASTETTNLAKLGGAVAGLVHANATTNANEIKNNMALAGQVKDLGAEEKEIIESEASIKQQGQELNDKKAEIQAFQEKRDKLQGSQQRLAKMGFQDQFIDQTINKLNNEIKSDEDMYNKSMAEMEKKAKILDIQKKNFETRKKLIEDAIERSGK